MILRFVVARESGKRSHMETPLYVLPSVSKRPSFRAIFTGTTGMGDQLPRAPSARRITPVEPWSLG